MVLVVAHRGDPANYRENTLPGLKSAMVGGADWVEADVKLTQDRVPVLLHDQTLARIWGVNRRLDSIVHSDLALIIGDDGWQVPTLEDAILLAISHQVPLMIDISNVAEGKAALEVAMRMKALDLVVLAGDPDALAYVRTRTSRALIAMSWSRSPFPPQPLLSAVRPQYLNELYTWLSELSVQLAHNMGMKVSTYVVDDRLTVKHMIKMGVDAVVANDFRSAMSVVADLSP